jgi:hypothetical protein
MDIVIVSDALKIKSLFVVAAGINPNFNDSVP